MSIQIHEAHSFLVRLKLASLRGSSSSADSVFNETDSRYVFDEQILWEDCHTPRCNSYGTRRPNEPDGEVWRRQICWFREETWWCQENLWWFSEQDSDLLIKDIILSSSLESVSLKKESVELHDPLEKLTLVLPESCWLHKFEWTSCSSRVNQYTDPTEVRFQEILA